MFRRRRSKQPSPEVVLDDLDPRWRGSVAGVVEARRQFGAIVERTPPGPLRTRLEEMAPQLDTSVTSALDTARRAQTTAETLRTFEIEEVRGRLKEARRRAADGDPTAADEVERLSEQFGSLNRLMNRLDEAPERLRQLELRLEAAVARAAELVLAPSGGEAADLDGVVTELTALQRAFAEVEGEARP